MSRRAQPSGGPEPPVGAAEGGPADEVVPGEGASDDHLGAEAALEGIPGALSLAPTSTMPSIGGELLVATAPAPDGAAPDSVRRGLLQAGPLAVAGLIANGANVVVTILVARILTPRGYGQLAQLTGIFLIVSMPGAAVAVGVVRRVTAWHGRGSAGLVQRWARHVHGQATLVVIAFALVTLAVGGPLARALGQPHQLALDAMVVAGGLFVLFSFDRGLLQAHRNYRDLSYNLLVEGGVRTAAVLCFTAAGLGVPGAALGYLVGEAATALHARILADRTWAAEARAGGQEPVAGRRGIIAVLRPDTTLAAPSSERRALRTDLAVAFVSLGLIALLQNIDVIVVARDSPHLSGSYAAISVASKALVFGAIALGAYLLPEAAIRWHAGGHALRQLLVTLLLLAVPAVVLLVLALAAPHLLLRIVFGAKYLGAQRAFAPLVGAMICLSVTVVLTLYLLAVGRRFIAAVLAVGAAVATVAVVAANGVPLTTARADLAVQASLALVTVVGFVAVHRGRVRTG